MENPLLRLQGLPPFSTILPEHVEPAIDQLLADGRSLVDSLLVKGGPYTWNNLVQPLEAMDDQLNRSWSPVSHMNSVVNNEALRTAYNACLPKLSEYSTEISQNEALYAAYREVQESDQNLDGAQIKMLENILLDFQLSGVGLDLKAKNRFKEISQSLSKLTSKYAENVLDATNNWHKLIEDESLLAGLPQSAKELARQTAEQRGKSGWMITLEFPSYLPLMTYADNPELRQEVYEAFATRASDQGPRRGKWDNSDTMEQILALRHETAQLLGFNNYAEHSLARKMAPSAQGVIDFLEDLAQRSHVQAKQELADLERYTQEQFQHTGLEAWDIGYYAEKLREHQYAISQEELKPYFPESQVVSGLFSVVERLYGIQIEEIHEFDRWHAL